MDWVQIHLALNHIPVVGLPLLGMMLIVGWWRQSGELIRLALWSVLFLAAAAIANLGSTTAVERTPRPSLSRKRPRLR